MSRLHLIHGLTVVCSVLSVTEVTQSGMLYKALGFARCAFTTSDTRYVEKRQKRRFGGCSVDLDAIYCLADPFTVGIGRENASGATSVALFRGNLFVSHVESFSKR